MGCHTARTGLGCLSPNHPPASHLQQLQQGRRVPVPRGVEEQDAHLGPPARRGEEAGNGRTAHLSRRNYPPSTGPATPHPSPRPRPFGPRAPPLRTPGPAPPDPGPRPCPTPPRTHLWRRRGSAWRNQRTQACTLLEVCAPSRYQVRGPRHSICVRPGHSVSRSPGGRGKAALQTPIFSNSHT